MRELRVVLRRLLRAPGFTGAALLTLALGIGANTAVFTVFNSVLLRPLPYDQPEALVSVWLSAPGLDLAGMDGLNCAPTLFETFREESRAFTSIGLWQRNGATVAFDAESDSVPVLQVTQGLFETLGVRPAMGRWFSAEDDRPGAPRTVVLDHGYWQRRFGGDPDVIGRVLSVNEQPTEVIGVTPAGLRVVDTQASLYLPQQFDRAQLFLGNFSHQCVARLAPGTTLAQANADVARMLPTWMESWPPPPGFDANLFEEARLGPALRPLKEQVVGDLADVLWVVLATVGLVLLIACANVANLLLVRAEGRHQELAIRAALGASRGDIARDLLSESVLLGLAGGLLGLGLAHLAVEALVAGAPDGLPRVGEIAIDPLVLVFAFTVSVASGLLFGWVPVLRHRGGELGLALRGAGRAASASRERRRARNTLVVVQVALALVLLVGAGLMIRTVQHLSAVDPGVTDPERIQTLRIVVRDSQAEDGEPVTRLLHALTDRVATLPGVEAVAFTNSAPMQGFDSSDVLFVEGRADGDIPPIRRFKFVSPGSFEALGTRLVAGRDFAWDDLYQRRRVAVVSEGFAREVWGDPARSLGERVRANAADPWREIVGVVAPVRDDGLRQPAPPTIYWPALMERFWTNEPFAQRAVVLLVRSPRVGQSGFLDQVRGAIEAEGSFPLSLLQTVGDLFDRSMARTSFTLVVLAIAGGMALLLGLVGIYGVMSYSVTQRVKEIGIRMALGAERASVRGMFVRHGVLLAAAGVAAGLVAAAGATRLMSSLLFGISALDPITYLGVAALLAAAAALASFVPARRATGVDPMTVLRGD